MIYNYIESISNKDKLVYILLFFVLLFILKDTSIVHLTTLIVLGLLVYYHQDELLTKKEDSYSVLFNKLKLLDAKQPKYLHLDADLIQLFFSIKDMKKYNPSAYRKALYATDNFLSIKFIFEKEIQNSGALFEIAEMVYKKGINYLHAFIYSLPEVEILHYKLTRVLERYQILMKRNLDDMLQRHNKLNKIITNKTKFITDYNKAQPYDPVSTNFDFY